jgi:DMSO/TMAO reductase YedYZ molybdopterin-dependent catalytic subunit
MSGFVSRGFGSRRRAQEEYGDRLPPGQYLERAWPVLTAGPTPRIEPDEWEFTIDGMVGGARTWSAAEFRALPQETITRDIHCVTKWSKFDVDFGGVSLDTLLGEVQPDGKFAMAHSYGGYTTNMPVADLTGGKAWVVTEAEGEPLPAEHGGPARLLVPHLYFWKSAKWLRGLRIMDHDEAGFWELNGYHNYGDPWREQRYWGD